MYQRFLDRFSTPRHIAVFSVLTSAIFILLNYTQLPFSIPTLQSVSGGYGILNLIPFYSADQAYAHLMSYGERGRAVYFAIVAIDVLVLIPSYVLMFGLSLNWSANRVFRGGYATLRRVLLVLPLVAGGLNLIEDASIMGLLIALPQQSIEIAGVLGVLSGIKISLFAICTIYVCFLYALIAASRGLYGVGVRECHL